MIYRIETADLAEGVLRSIAAARMISGLPQQPGPHVVFDIKEGLKIEDIPVVLRKCPKCEGEVLTWDLWNFLACHMCLCNLETLAVASIVLQGDTVVNTIWRSACTLAQKRLEESGSLDPFLSSSGS